MAYSHDGGLTWGPVKLVDDLIDPTNNARSFGLTPMPGPGRRKPGSCYSRMPAMPRNG
ncbi:sialidase [Cutibacterium acnes JCM 18918]|nr:sialidase [Cutibacterium acnes JCM 18918]